MSSARRLDSPLGLRNVALLWKSPLELLETRTRYEGDVARFRLFGQRITLLRHPDDIEAVLVRHQRSVVRDRYSRVLERALGKGLLTSEGDLWKRQRRLAATAFTPKRIRGYGDTMAQVTERGITRWRDGETVHLHEEMSRLTMAVVSEVLFGASIDDRDVEVVRAAMDVSNQYFTGTPEGMLAVPEWLPTPNNRRLMRAIASIDEMLFRIVRAKRLETASRDDLLGALVAAVDEDGSRMDDRQLRDETFTMFVAGHETTSLALTHALYFLSNHPEARRRIEHEVDTVLGGRTPGADDVARLGYVERVVKEGMRLLPPAWMSGREVAEPFELEGRDGARPLRFEKGTQILASQWIVHRDPRWYPNPEAFDPDRWEPDAVKARPRFSYFPFGGGPRVCIGNHFAMVEATLMLATIVQRFRLELAPFSRLALEPSATLRPAGRGLRTLVVAREATRTEERGSLSS